MRIDGLDAQQTFRILQLIAVGLAVVWFTILLVKRRLRRASYAERQEFIGEERYHDRDERLSQEERLPYYARESLLSRAEQLFYIALQEAVGNECAISLKVRAADVINCSDKAWKAGYGAPIAWKHFDFVLHDSVTGVVACVVELNDSSHRQGERGQRDAFIYKALADAGVDIAVFPAERLYQSASIRAVLDQLPGMVRLHDMAHGLNNEPAESG